MAYTGEARREYQRRWLQARRDKAIEYLGGACVECGNTEQLEFDHKFRELKSANISTLLSRKWEVLVVELDKCQLLCNACHKAKTIKEQSTAQHGTVSMYRYHSCRCEACKAAKSVENATRYGILA